MEDLSDTGITTFCVLHLINKNIDDSFGYWLARLLDISRTNWINLLRHYVAIEVSMNQGGDNRLNTATRRAENVPDDVIPEWIHDFESSDPGTMTTDKLHHSTMLIENTPENCDTV